MKKQILSFNDYYNKVLGGWIGKCAGGILGAPIEGIKAFNDIQLSDKLFETNFANDDLDLQVLWLDMVKKKGPLVNEADLRAHWEVHVRFPWGEYGIAYRNIKAGLDIPDSGVHNNHYWYRGMGSPIRSEIWGMLCPGDPKSAMSYAKIDSLLDHHGFSVEAEMFLSAAAAIAFFETDVRTALDKTLMLFDEESDIRQLVQTVYDWHAAYPEDIVAAKIKSRYGDADFTSAPLNVAFTVLALLMAENSFDGIMTALHYGHDSDCVVATAGALIGIINGYDRIPQSWKDRVGNELLVSPEIINIDHTDTVTGLAEETCRAGLSFIRHYEAIEITEVEKSEYDVNIPSVSLTTRVVHFPHRGTGENGRLEVDIAYREDAFLNQGYIRLSSPYFEDQSMEIASGVQEGILLDLVWKGNIPEADNPFTYHYTISYEEQGENTISIQRGIPNYGSWKLIGPFIKDDPSLAPMHPDYPDHGLSSMPSFNYMNRDKLNLEEDFINTDTIIDLEENGELYSRGFDVQTIFPKGFKIDLNQYYKGRGERTLYLYTTLDVAAATKKWITLGCSAYFKLWLNGELVLSGDEIIRSWPYAHFALLDLEKGTNHILIKIDSPTDHLDFETGLKEFIEKHPHQSEWDRELIFKA